VDVLVVANAESPSGSAFSDEEIAALKQWVEGGGSLLLIADHAPFGRAAAALAAAFGVDMGTGYAVARQSGKVTSNVDFAGKALGDHAILRGRDKKEQVRRVKSFTGQSLGAPAGADSLLILPDDALEVANARAVDELRGGGTVPGGASAAARRRWPSRSARGGWWSPVKRRCSLRSLSICQTARSREWAWGQRMTSASR
jgi:hypothetical protein